jgi:hypothetical protein
MMNLYLISQENYGYDDYDAAVVTANSETEARHIHPDGRMPGTRWWKKLKPGDSWVAPDAVTVKFIGTCAYVRPTVILASYNAG